jgi:phosphatidyl-myo-inositol dimannoside synthase
MKILFIATSKISNTGGIQEYNRNLLKVLGSSSNKIQLIELIKANFLGKLLLVIKTFFYVFKNNPDVIFCSHVNLSPLCFVVCKLFNKNYIVFTHGTDVWNLESVIKIKCFEKAKFVVTVSNFTKSKIIEQIPGIEPRIYLLPNTVNENRFHFKEKSKNLIRKHKLEGKKIIFTLARLSKLEEYKGYDKVIRAIPKVLEKIPNATYILGGKGDGLKDIKKLVDRLGLGNTIIMPGFIPNEELVDYYNIADVYIMPSKKDGFGIVFLESLACGTPVIAGNKDGSVDPLQNGKTGLLINPDDMNSIIKALTSVLNGKVENENIINPEYLRNQTIKEFGFNEFKKKLNILLHEL